MTPETLVERVVRFVDEYEQVCRHCGEAISEITYCGKSFGWIHHSEDGPDAYVLCDCHCFECDSKYGYAHETSCCDGEGAEPSKSYEPPSLWLAACLDLPQCSGVDGYSCPEPATVHHLASEQDFCLRHFEFFGRYCQI